MKVAIVFFEGKNRQKLFNLVKALSQGIESQGHQVDIIDGSHDVSTRLSMHQYIIMGTESKSTIGGKIPEKVASFLADAGVIQGKRSFAFVSKTFFGSEKALTRLMSSMEKEGMFLKYSEIIQTSIEAEEIGKRLHIEQA